MILRGAGDRRREPRARCRAGHASRTTPARDRFDRLLLHELVRHRPGSNGPLGMFGHLWSLAIEEQFYLVWPIVVLASVTLGSRRVGPFLRRSSAAAASAAPPRVDLARGQGLGRGRRHARRAGRARRRRRRRTGTDRRFTPRRRPADRLRSGRARREPAGSDRRRACRGPLGDGHRLGRPTGCAGSRRRHDRPRSACSAPSSRSGSLDATITHVFPEFLIGPGCRCSRSPSAWSIVNLVVNARGVMAQRAGVEAARVDRSAVVRDLRAPPDLHHRRCRGPRRHTVVAGARRRRRRSWWPGSRTGTTRRRSSA